MAATKNNGLHIRSGVFQMWALCPKNFSSKKFLGTEQIVSGGEIGKQNQKNRGSGNRIVISVYPKAMTGSGYTPRGTLLRVGFDLFCCREGLGSLQHSM